MKLRGSTAWDWVVSSVHGKHVSDGVWEAHWGLTWVGLATPLLVILNFNLLRTSDSNCLKNWLSLVLYKCLVVSQMLSCVWLFATPWTVAHQAPLSMKFSRQEYWSGLPFSLPGDLPNPGVKPMSLTSPASAGGFLLARCVLDSCSNVRCNRVISSLAFFNANKLAESLHLILGNAINIFPFNITYGSQVVIPTFYISTT